MIRLICLWVTRYCMRQVTSWPWPALLTGIGGGLLLLVLQQQFFSQLGSSQLVTSTACIVMGLTWALAWGCRRDAVPADSPSRSWSPLAVPAFLVGWTMISPWIWEIHERFFAESMLASRGTLLAYLTAWAVVMLGIPVWCVARLSFQKVLGNAATQTGTSPSAGCILGVSLGLGLGLFCTWGSLFVTAVIGGVVLLGAQAWRILKSGQNASAKAMEAPVVRTSTGWDFGLMLVAMACGGLGLWAVPVFELLLPTTLHTLTTIISGLLLGVACGCLIPRRSVAARAGLELVTRCWLVAMLLVLSAGFSAVVFQFVTLTGTVSRVWLLHGVRSAFIVGCTFPLGFEWAAATSRLSGFDIHSGDPARPRAWGLGVILALVGGILSDAILLPACGLTLTCYLWLWVIAGVQIIELIRHRTLPRWTLVRVLAVGCLGALLTAPLGSSGVQPELAGRLLFSTNVFHADQLGTPRPQLAFLDESRLVARMQGERGVYTVWRSAVARHQVRENGIPHGCISTNTEISPQDTSEVVLALLPLTLHERPHRVAVLGLGASTPLQTCLGCPILEVTAVETDPQLVALLQQVTAGTEAAAQWQDERLTLHTVDPALWVAGTGESFDVVISNPDSSALIQGSSQFTAEFYRRASRRLTADGIFCQRFQFHDYGAVPLQTMAATLRSVFGQVLAVEIGPGEIAWLGTNSAAGFIRAEVVERMQAPHVRQLMSSVGWDWSVLLTLAAYDDAGLAKVVAGKIGRINTAANGRFSTQLPNELMRWGNKPLEIQLAVTAHAGKLLNWVGDAGSDEDLLRRLGEVRGQQELVAKFPDQFWGYRSQVKKQISSRPLSRIQQVKHEGQQGREEGVGLHPDDKRRLRYFQQLSKAIHTDRAVEVLKLAEYAAPYDPLVSLFMHQEVAEIAARFPELPPRLELTHRLHMLYFSPSTDSSVRNALSALRLVLEKPDCVTSNTERWDIMNGLLQMLQVRWQNRSPEQISDARMATRDLEENIVLAERALEELPNLATEAGFSTADWKARKRNIERNLLGPLRGYRERLQPIAAKQRFDTLEEGLDGTLPSDEDLQFPGSAAAE